MSLETLLSPDDPRSPRERWAALSLDERLAVADRIPECGHALAELRTALDHLDREALVYLERASAA